MAARRSRERFGTGALSLNPATSVFLNCPHDLEYQTLFDSAVLSIVCCGFTPRSALESGTIAEPRMARITRAIFESKYSIHDLSRCKGEGVANLARFNIPLELGIAMARRYLGRRAAGKHDWLAMVPTGHQYGRYISDLAGFDPVTHNNTEEGVVRAIMTWLGTRVDAADTLNPQQVLKGTPQFSGDMRLLRRTWGQWPPWESAAKAPGNYLDHGLHLHRSSIPLRRRKAPLAHRLDRLSIQTLLERFGNGDLPRLPVFAHNNAQDHGPAYVRGPGVGRIAGVRHIGRSWRGKATTDPLHCVRRGRVPP